jgi:hypothetical protein
MKYFAAGQRWKGKPLLRFFDNTEQIYIVDGYV